MVRENKMVRGREREREGGTGREELGEEETGGMRLVNT